MYRGGGGVDLPPEVRVYFHYCSHSIFIRVYMLLNNIHLIWFGFYGHSKFRGKTGKNESGDNPERVKSQ